MSADLVVPAWCDFFDTNEYAAFSEAVDGACGCYGAEGQDFDDGELCMYVGDRPEEGVLSLVALAAQCRDSPAEEWESICFARISAWVEGEAQREWLTQMPFAEVEPRLEVWLGDQHPVMYEGGRPGDPDEPFAMGSRRGAAPESDGRGPGGG